MRITYDPEKRLTTLKERGLDLRMRAIFLLAFTTPDKMSGKIMVKFVRSAPVFQVGSWWLSFGQNVMPAAASYR